MATALITGATAGIGAAFARLLAARGNDLIVVSRDEKRLTATAAELAEAHGVDVRPVAADLTDDADCATVATHAAEVDLLVNNAGMALRKGFTYNDLSDEERILNLNVRSVLRLTHAALPAMAGRGRGAIVNVSSVAGFAPTSPNSTYGAGKAWVTNFSQSLAPVAREDGVRVMALCPGFVRTEFHERAGIDMSGTPGWMLMDADFVAETAMRDLLRGKTVSVPSFTYKLIVSGIRHIPLNWWPTLATQGSKVMRRGYSR
ncbi:SDR family NAD(P)-dependent oxidoreductase [Stackebrandtia nassauensis]|uniref:Short-chain dehydrogenase/reductase SDR n=1 Tax=Stackebrandtia nassauensis (strain DSM 44728 / CIP 108903 / NRRL B-16338 / NBRC 102104 / LLR-40K-21) TaxID=446470 RepID=D3Q5H6_STANL|nr:SDR family NAD(P)-dependent oxidoreductase [Stackebrandtia nassauensis]ADD46036.1 short-chain dehydrogenase/reductase SDR [Stackebrandtia nassauensis DSM 44728]